MSGRRRVVEVLREFSIPLLAGVLAALAWANLDEPGYRAALGLSPFGVGHPFSLQFVANEILMVFFFGIAAKEITESCLPGGALHPFKKALNPVLGTVGGVLGPIAVYLVMVRALGAPHLASGWGVPTATDIALAWLVARTAFGPRHPAVSYLLLLAVADDAIGMAILAIFYPDPLHAVKPLWLGFVVLGMAIAWVMRRRRVISFWPYLAVPGGMSWVGLYFAHLHPALALVVIVPFMPHAARDYGLFEELEGAEQSDTMSRFERAFRKPIDFGMFAFGLVNAGVPFGAVGPATWSVVTALVVGKTLGITSCALLADRAGFRLPDGMDGKSLVLAGMTGGLGLTVALFVAGAAFTDPTTQAAAKMGALLSAVAAPLVLIGARLFQVKRQLHEP